MMGSLIACGWCRHWGDGTPPARVRVGAIYDFAGDGGDIRQPPYPRGIIVTMGMTHCQAPYQLPDDAPAALDIMATDPLDGLGCPRFEHRDRSPE